MKKSYLFLTLLAIFCVACDSDSEWIDSSLPQQAPADWQFVLEDEYIPTEVFDEYGNEIVSLTRAYLNATSSSFDFKWETGDTIEYYFWRADSVLFANNAFTFRTTPTGSSSTPATAYTINGVRQSGVAANDIFYSYHRVGGTPAASPKCVTMSIPSEQYTTISKLDLMSKDDDEHYTVPSQSSSSYRLGVRDAMPRVSEPKNITSSMINNVSFTSSATYRSLGSIFEARIYSTDNAIGVGENVQYIQMISTDETPLCGTFDIDITSRTSAITNIQGPDCVTSYVPGNANQYKIAKGQDNYKYIDMVLAPGTYPAALIVVTDQHQYIVEYASKEYKPAVRKSCYVNLATALCRPLPTVEPYHVTSTLTKAFFTIYSGDEILPGDNFFATLNAKMNYQLLPENVTITMGGVDVTANVYNPQTGAISIYETTGDIDIVATATLKPKPVTYSVTDELNYCYYPEPINRTITKNANGDTPFGTEIVPFDGYYIEEGNVHITMGNEDITDCFDIDTYYLYVPNVTGNIRIVIGATKFESEEVDGDEGGESGEEGEEEEGEE